METEKLNKAFERLKSAKANVGLARRRLNDAKANMGTAEHVLSEAESEYLAARKAFDARLDDE